MYSYIEEDKAIIGNNFYKVVFNRDNGNLFQIYNVTKKVNYLKNGDNKQFYLWTLLADKRDSYRYGNDEQPYLVHYPNEENLQKVESINSKNSSKLIFKFEILDKITVKTIFLARNDKLLRCRINIKNLSDDYFHNQIIAVGFPQIENLIIGDYSTNTLVRPNRFGEKIEDPITNAGKYTINLEYGGYASMQWQDLYSPQGGLYLASYDKDMILSVLESEPNLHRKTLRLGIRKYVYIPPGSKWISNEYVLGIHEGDWHWAADRYREWAETWIKKPIVPKWFEESDGFYGIGFNFGEKKLYNFKDIPQILKDAFSMGLNHIQFWGQMSGPRKSCCYRFYYPDPRLGDESEFIESIKKVKEMGGHIGFYFNIQAFDPDLPNLPEDLQKLIPSNVRIPRWEDLRKSAQVHFDGSYIRQYPSRPEFGDGFRIMCLCGKEWREYLMYWIVEKYVKEYGIDSVYVDQTFSPPICYCFNFDHGHKHHGDTVKCRVDFIKELRQILKKIDPSIIIIVEGNGDSVGQYADGFLYTSFSSQTKFPKPEVFFYTFPYFNIIDGFANPPVKDTLEAYFPYLNKISYEDILNRVYLMGFKFDITLYRRLEKNSHFVKYLKKILVLRNKIKKYLLNSRFIDDIYILSLPEKVEAKMFMGYRFILINLLDYRDVKSSFDLIIDINAISDYSSNISSKIYTFDVEEKIPIDNVNNKIIIKVPYFEEHIASIVVKY
ncbi:MAG: hypothetical protein J7K23_09915 [Thermoproteales archaeon]|nr:hypothetical protein [Thermoproteales archaeon]